MRTRVALALPAVLLALVVGQAAPAKNGNHDYIVVLKDGASVSEVLESYAHGTSVHDVYTDAVNGFAARLTPKTVDDLESDPRVLLISPDHPVQAADQETPTGVERIGAA